MESIERGIKKDPQKIAGLDTVRGLAILMVLIDHSIIFHNYNPEVVRIARNLGYFSMNLFFVLSGFLIYRTLFSNFEKKPKSNNRIDHAKIFFANRARRLLPAFYFYLFVVFFFWVFYGEFCSNTFWSFAASILYLRNYFGRGSETGLIWSLCVEVHFYVICGLLFLVGLSQKALFKLAIGIISVSCAYRVILGSLGYIEISKAYNHTETRIDALFIGFVVSLMDGKNFSIWHSANTVMKQNLQLLGLVLASCFMCYYLDENSMVIGFGSIYCLILSVIIVLWGARSPDGVWFLSYLGKVSYGVYLWQGVFLGPPDSFIGILRNKILGPLLSLFSGIASYYLIESRFQSFAKNEK